MKIGLLKHLIVKKLIDFLHNLKKEEKAILIEWKDTNDYKS